MSVVFFTCANLAYEDFAPLYIYSILNHVAESKVEIGVEDTRRFLSLYGPSLDLIVKTFGDDRFHFREVEWCLPTGIQILPNTVRFVNEPTLKARYVYIGDIDIIILDRQFLSRHLTNMNKTGLPYSNSVRQSTHRMTGLHFTEMNAHYPLPDISDLDISKMNDERVLYEIISRKKLPIRDNHWYRPTHGIHISPNRNPELIVKQNNKPKPGWGIRGNEAAWLELNKQEAFVTLRKLLSARVRQCLLTIDKHCLAPPQSPLASL